MDITAGIKWCRGKSSKQDDYENKLVSGTGGDMDKRRVPLFKWSTDGSTILHSARVHKSFVDF